MMLRPATEVGRSPASTPSGIPRPSARISAATASSIVAGSRVRITSTAGRP